MSYEVVWRLLGADIISILREQRLNSVALDVYRKAGTHPLIRHIEKELTLFFKPNGGLSCPDLEYKILDFVKKDYKLLRIILKGIIINYFRKTYNISSKDYALIP